MTDDPALAAAVAAAPDDDLPRLVAADWLDDRGHPDRAEFVRAQVRLAATDSWEPFAVLCRHRRPDWASGDRWRDALPRVDGDAVAWHPDRAFRRGFGWAVRVRDVRYFLTVAPRLFADAPVGELHLPTATLDEWRAFARADWLPRVKAVHFFGTTTPVEPVRELIASPLATGIEEIVFEKASGAGLPVLLEDLFTSPLGRQLKRLELRVGPDNPGLLFEAVAGAASDVSLDRFSFVTFTWPWMSGHRFYGLPILEWVSDLELSHIPRVPPPGLDPGTNLPRLRRFRAAGCGYQEGPAHLLPVKSLTGLRGLDLSDNPLGEWTGTFPASRNQLGMFPNLRALALRRTQSDDGVVAQWLTRAGFWPNLVELDLRDNRITDAGAKRLLEASIPPDLTALLLDGNPIGDGMRDRLRGHFGDALVL